MVVLHHQSPSRLQALLTGGLKGEAGAPRHGQVKDFAGKTADNARKGGAASCQVGANDPACRWARDVSGK